MKKSSYLSERVYDAIPSEINMESLEYWKKTEGGRITICKEKPP